jgi:hypothetical protein
MIADSSMPSHRDKKDLRKNLSARSSKSPVVINLPESTKGPADLMQLPAPEDLEKLCRDEILKMVEECKYINK